MVATSAHQRMTARNVTMESTITQIADDVKVKILDG